MFTLTTESKLTSKSNVQECYANADAGDRLNTVPTFVGQNAQGHSHVQRTQAFGTCCCYRTVYTDIHPTHTLTLLPENTYFLAPCGFLLLNEL